MSGIRAPLSHVLVTRAMPWTHPASPNVGTARAQSSEGLGLDPACAPQTFDEYAHLGAVGVIANLLAARDASRLRRGATVALYAQGAGFTRSAALLRW